jgi:mitochondrial fission protein ELM1
MDGLLGMADVAVVTGESISMMSEACASGKQVLAIEPPRSARGQTKHRAFLEDLKQQGLARLCDADGLADAILEAIRNPSAAPPSDMAAAIRAAMENFI